MRNAICLLGLLLTSGAVLAQQAPATTRYLTLVRESQYTPSGGTYRSSLTVIGPDGSIKTEEFWVDRDRTPKQVVRASIVRALADSSNWVTRRSRYAENLVYQAETNKLNELGAQGWQLVNTLQEGLVVRYLFRQDAQPRQ
ncbi:hypothetical protein EJV47_13865 [Hymenobacter gummosus]|uniref:Uncharacterized protein n=1 Tax=Hymenobacter gummosus TaxID=1776032 RepID=A0A431U1Z1_9BACT|nr:hypothetical protein [Hymenobacter gummosus]RTQ49228.1 hypothetical protein EJV47_13865 [Hymenobacter gummosus]